MAWRYLPPQEEGSLSEITSRFGVSTATARVKAIIDLAERVLDEMRSS
ncbi:MAG: hypothetical protein JO362_22625 [Streptomycetaceae bacterium]|nr:hypothetical protein [Streptomycetaceae bacterium]